MAMQNAAENQAYIEIENYDQLSWNNLSMETPAKSQVSPIEAARQKLAGIADVAATTFANSSKTSSVPRQHIGEIKDGIIKVQYNPQSIKFSGSAKRTENTAEEQKQNIKTVVAWGVVTMSVELVFHGVSQEDKFVSEQMKMLLTTMKKSETKKIKFYWADLMIEGKVISFSGEYNMFWPSGNPRSGKIELEIQAETEPKKISVSIEKLTEERSEKLADPK